MANRVAVREADDWWASLPDDRRTSYHRWLTGQNKSAPAPDPDQLSLLDVIEPPPEVDAEAEGDEVASAAP